MRAKCWSQPECVAPFAKAEIIASVAASASGPRPHKPTKTTHATQLTQPRKACASRIEQGDAPDGVRRLRRPAVAAADFEVRPPRVEVNIFPPQPLGFAQAHPGVDEYGEGVANMLRDS